LTRACLGLGGNIHPRISFLSTARNWISHQHGIRVLRAASLYESEPWGNPDQPLFLNSALLISTDIPPRELLHLLKEIERKTGRISSSRWGPREIDLDILYYGDRIIKEPDLTIPHAHLLARSFALYPAVELDPLWVHPERQVPLHKLMQELTFVTFSHRIDHQNWPVGPVTESK